MKRWMTGRNGWIWFLGTMLVIDATFEDEHMLSSAFYRFTAKHPVLAHFFVVSCAAHLLELVPKHVDVWSLSATVMRGGMRWLLPHRVTVTIPDDVFAVEFDCE